MIREADIPEVVKSRLPLDKLPAFCERWKIAELSVFGSILTDAFRPDSDVDLMIVYEPDADWGLLDHCRMERELEQLLGREVDVLLREGVEESYNWIRREEILSTAKVIYET